jgi:hypothetical protein
VPPLRRGVAAPFQGVAGHHDGPGNQAVAPLVVAADIDQQSAAGLRVQGLGGQWALSGSMARAWASSSSTVLAVLRPAMMSSRSGDVVPLSLAGPTLQLVCRPQIDADPAHWPRTSRAR